MAIFNNFYAILLGSFFVLGAVAQNYSITGYTVSGTGCAPGSVKSVLTSDKKNIAVDYSDFVAYTGPSYGYDDGRKNCQLTLSVKVPYGYQFAFDKFSHNGTLSIGTGVKATYSSYYYFQSSLDQSLGGGDFSGPYKSDCTLSDTFEPLTWSPCGKSSVVGINTVLQVDNGSSNGSGSFSLRRTSAASFVWRAC